MHALDGLIAELASLPVTSNNFGLIHGDINVGNFSVDESGRITLFDFDECQAQYELFIRHFELGYTEDDRQLPDGWKSQLDLFLNLREIIVVVSMHRSWDLAQADDWTREFLRESTVRITKGISLIDGFSEEGQR